MNAATDFRQRMRDLAHRFGLPAFWRWWVDELAPLVPAAPRSAVQRRRLRPVLAFAADAAVLWEPRIQDGVLAFAVSSRIPLQGDPAAVQQTGRAAIDALPQVAYGGAVAAAKVVVALPPGQVLRKRLTLPATVEQDLRQALAYDLDRHTPFKPDELYFDAAVVARDAQNRQIGVDWAAARKTVVDQARRQAESWGATVVAVTPDAPGSAGPATVVAAKLNLLPEADRPETAWWRRWHLLVPLALVGVLGLVAIVLPIVQKRDYAIALSRITEQARVEADASSALRAQLEALAGDYNFALGKKYAFPSAVQLLDDVTRILPDDTWLTQFELKTSGKGKELHREMLLRGESGNAGRLVTLLEESKLFAEAAPRSPTTKIQPGPGEIFDLGAQLKPSPPPESVQVASSTAAGIAAPPAPAAEAGAAAAALTSAATPPQPPVTAPVVSPAFPLPAPPATAPPSVAPPGAALPAAALPAAVPPAATPPTAAPPPGAAPPAGAAPPPAATPPAETPAPPSPGAAGSGAP